MTPWKRICCAIDFTEHSRVTFEEAVVAERLGAELTLVHVFEPPPQGDLQSILPASELFADSVREADRPVVVVRQA